MRLKLCKPYINGLETWTGHLRVCTIREYYNGWALGCQPPNFDPEISPKWHNSVKMSRNAFKLMQTVYKRI